VTIVAWSPLASGLLSGRYHRDADALKHTPAFRRGQLRRQLETSRPVVAALEEIAARYEATPAQVALNWVINFHGEAVVAIPGASKVGQAADNAGAMNFRLTEEELARLDEVSRAFR